MARKIRIARNPVTFRDALYRFNHLLSVLADIFIVQPAQVAERNRLDRAREDKIRMDIQVSEFRLRKLHNDLVIGDLRIEKMAKELGHVEGEDKFATADWR